VEKDRAKSPVFFVTRCDSETFMPLLTELKMQGPPSEAQRFWVRYLLKYFATASPREWT